MAGVRDHSELAVYRLSDQLEQDVREILERPAFRRDAVLHGQLDRSSSGPCPNIAEGFSRYYPLDNARFVRIARSSLSETIVHLGKALRKQLISTDEHEALVHLASRARGAATKYIVYWRRPPRPAPGGGARRAESSGGRECDPGEPGTGTRNRNQEPEPEPQNRGTRTRNPGTRNPEPRS
jgi:four helix bundle protein